MFEYLQLIQQSKHATDQWSALFWLLTFQYAYQTSKLLQFASFCINYDLLDKCAFSLQLACLPTTGFT